MIFDSGDTGDVGGYTIANSLRLRASASAYLSRTPASAGSQTTWTWAGWVKRGSFGDTAIFGCATSGTDYFQISWNAESLYVVNRPSGGAAGRRQTTAVFRDPSAHYHLCVVWDTSNATAADRLRMYVNGVRHTAFSTSVDPALNEASRLNIVGPHALGTNPLGPQYLDGYLSDVYFIDGQALDPTSFGQFNADGVWTPKAYTGTYGTNSFYMKFNDGSNLTNLCLDRSGNGNNWTATNVSLSAGSTYDWMVDTPSVNYCTLNPLNNFAVNVAPSVVQWANLQFTSSATVNAYSYITGTQAVTTGTWCYEVDATTLGNGDAFGDFIAGICEVNTSMSAIPTNHVYWSNDVGSTSAIYKNGSAAQSGLTSLTAGQTLGVVFDCGAQTVQFYVNGVARGSLVTSIGSLNWVPFFYVRQSSPAQTTTINVNFGQRPFAYSYGSAKALNTANLP